MIVGWERCAIGRHNTVVVSLIRRAWIKFALMRIDVEFLSDQIGLNGVRPLPLVSARRDQRNGISVNLHKWRDCGLAIGKVLFQRVWERSLGLINAKGNATRDSS